MKHLFFWKRMHGLRAGRGMHAHGPKLGRGGGLVPWNLTGKKRKIPKIQMPKNAGDVSLITSELPAVVVAKPIVVSSNTG